MFAAVLVNINTEAKREWSPCNRSIYVCGIKSNEKEEEEYVNVVVMMKKRPTWDASRA